jgi:hypothetical protein
LSVIVLLLRMPSLWTRLAMDQSSGPIVVKYGVEMQFLRNEARDPLAGALFARFAQTPAASGIDSAPSRPEAGDHAGANRVTTRADGDMDFEIRR